MPTRQYTEDHSGTMVGTRLCSGSVWWEKHSSGGGGGGAGGPVRLVFATNCYCKHSLLTQGQPALPAPNTTTTQHRISVEERRGKLQAKTPNSGENNKARQQQQHNMILRRRKGREKVIARKSRTKTQQQENLHSGTETKDFIG